MSNPTNPLFDGAGRFGGDGSLDPIEDASTDVEATDADVDVTADDAAVDGTSLDAVVDLMGDAGIDTIWLDLDGDLVPETMVAVDGPFEVADADAGMDEWTTYDELDLDGDLTGQPMSVLLPYEAGAGYPDPFALPTQDWCTCEPYDPMTVPSDWTTQGYATFEDAVALPGSEVAFQDAGAYYDGGAHATGYWDTTGYWDAAGGQLDTSIPLDTWDLPAATGYEAAYPGGFDGSFDGGVATGYDGGVATGFDATGYDTTGYDPSGYDATSGWDPTAGDAAHDAFIDTITTDYADPANWSAGEQSQFWMDEYQAADQLSWDAWHASVDAYVAGDDLASYDFNQVSLDAGSYANDAWSYSNDAWSSSGTTDFSTSGGYDADDGFYDAMSLDY